MDKSSFFRTRILPQKNKKLPLFQDAYDPPPDLNLRDSQDRPPLYPKSKNSGFSLPVAIENTLKYFLSYLSFFKCSHPPNFSFILTEPYYS